MKQLAAVSRNLHSCTGKPVAELGVFLNVIGQVLQFWVGTPSGLVLDRCASKRKEASRPHFVMPVVPSQGFPVRYISSCVRRLTLAHNNSG
jgi:hypothetical protein